MSIFSKYKYYSLTMHQYRSHTFDFQSLLSTFNNENGYYDLSNSDIAYTLKNLNLLEEDNRKDENCIKIYKRWSFTASFLQMLNAWQWFFSGILLGRQANLPAQTMQMNYYSIFFSYGSFLSAQFKGHYTVETKIDNNV